MAKRLIILAACAAMEAGASDQPASKTFLITGETKLLTPASQAITANDQASSAATIVAVREFEFRDLPSDKTAAGTGSLLATEAVQFTPAMNLGSAAIIGIGFAAGVAGAIVGSAIDDATTAMPITAKFPRFMAGVKETASLPRVDAVPLAVPLGAP